MSRRLGLEGRCGGVHTGDAGKGGGGGCGDGGGIGVGGGGAGDGGGGDGNGGGDDGGVDSVGGDGDGDGCCWTSGATAKPDDGDGASPEECNALCASVPGSRAMGDAPYKPSVISSSALDTRNARVQYLGSATVSTLSPSSVGTDSQLDFEPPRFDFGLPAGLNCAADITGGPSRSYSSSSSSSRSLLPRRAER